MKLIVGLGNPGKEYANARHNAGFLALDRAAEDATWSTDAALKAELAKTQIGGEPVILAKPLTYMNASGEAVRAIASYYKVDPADILVVQDEMDLAPGTLSFLAKGGAAGHNGITSIQEQMGTDAITRLRIGVGRPTPPMAKEDWVLGKMEDATAEILTRAAEAIEDWVEKGTEQAMNTWNRK